MASHLTRSITCNTRLASLGLLLLLLVSVPAQAEWRVPENPDPSEILKEARKDTQAKRYEDALAKHVWFHHNALRYTPSLYGVRLSYALGDWRYLSTVYPPALTKLHETRADAESKVKQGINARAFFHDFSSISDVLGEHEKTRDLFQWLDMNKRQTARSVYDVAQPSLVKTAEYKLCDRYIDGKSNFERIRANYQTTKLISMLPGLGKETADFAEQYFSNQTATLVALLVLNQRMQEAEQVRVAAKKELDRPSFHKQLDSAFEGKVPKPWPDR